ncbi:type II toxin-antitoxin system PemK/MazF family toxin [Devosia ginsengisoli]|uniref:type II toxin-antitoxin system PemK/MazF family toxin n=1 Tax=Devosia ginsengisoli TaxID=400770 RepID=UPI0026EBD4A1|nr:type II toxin-antitoxin system PemK/MazF family toxin [Devosia ginsengisoli]MCR6669985.1 type II toxin-antitoxin system PemK/MazF family toxin [Devosia ginsengisoli]
MPTYEFGDTILVPFPFTELPLSKRRPSVVLSSRSFNQACGQSIMGMITSATRSIWTGDITITDLEAAGIPHPSVIRFKLFTLPNDLVLRQLGRLGLQDQENLRTGMADIFG